MKRIFDGVIVFSNVPAMPIDGLRQMYEKYNECEGADEVRGYVRNCSMLSLHCFIM